MKLCEVQIVYRPKLVNANHPQIRCSNDIAALRWEMFSEDMIEYRETFALLFLNSANRVLGVSKLFAGGITATPVDVRLVIQQALLANATRIILCHNHPSGYLVPSANDDEVTRRVDAAAGLMNIRLLDHLIMSTDDYYSYADHGRI